MDHRPPRTATGPGRSQAFRLLSPPPASVSCSQEARAGPFCGVKAESRQAVPWASGPVGKVLGAPHSTLPGFMRPRGSSVALSCRMVSMPTTPTSSCSSCCLPSPMPCSPVHVPWSARARLGTVEKRLSAGCPSHSCQPAPTSRTPALLLPAQLVCKGLDPAELLSVLRVYHQDAVEVTVAHVSHNASWGAQRTELLPRPSLPPSPPGLQQQAGRTCEPRGLQVLLGLHQDLWQPGDGNTNVGGIALDRGQAREVLPSPLA